MDGKESTMQTRITADVAYLRKSVSVRVVRGLGAAAGLWVVESLRDGRWQQAALPGRTKAEALALAAVVREHGAILGR